MLDDNYQVTYHAHKNKRLQTKLRMGWLFFSVVLAVVWTCQMAAPYKDAQCYYNTSSEQVVLVNDPNNSDIVNVGAQFNTSVLLFVIQTYIMVALGIYWVFALFCVPALLKLRNIIGVINKLNLVFGVVILVLVHHYRLSAAGKACSGENLAVTPSDIGMAGYTIQRGAFLQNYLMFVWILLGVLGFGMTVTGIVVAKAFY